MSEIWTIMTATLGVPPRPDDAFTWEYLDGDGKFRSWSGTPLEFYKAFTSRQYPVGGVYLNLRVSFSAEFFFSQRIPSLLSTTLGMNIKSSTLLISWEISGGDARFFVILFWSKLRSFLADGSDGP